MKKRLKVSGSGWQLYFGKDLLELLGCNPKDTNVLITAKDEYLIIEPIANNTKDTKNLMIRKFQKSGTSGYGIYFPNTLIDYLEVDPETDDLDIKISNGKMFIKKG